MNKIYTSYFSKIRQIKFEIDNPCFINIARFVKPEIFKDINMSVAEFMPSSDLLHYFKSTKDLDKERVYTLRYNEELELKKDKIEALLKNHIVPKLENFDCIFLLCYEKPENFCHRHLLRKFLLKNFNLSIEEYI